MSLSDDENGIPLEKTEQVNKKMSNAGAMLNVARLSPFIQVPSKVGSIFGDIQYYSGNAGISVGNSIRSLWSGTQVAPLANPNVVTAASSFSLNSLTGWTSLLIAGGGAIEVANDVRHHQYEKAGRAAIVTASTVATVIEESALIASYGAFPIFALEAGSLLLTGKGIGKHIGEFVADLFFDKATPEPKAVAPYGVPLQNQVIPPSMTILRAPSHMAGDGIAQVMPNTGQVATAMLAPQVTMATGWRNLVTSQAGKPVTAPAGSLAEREAVRQAAAAQAPQTLTP